MKPEDKILWQSKLFPKLLMTDVMLRYLKLHYPIVKEWKGMMLELEAYLARKAEKRPKKDWKKFVFNCARRRAEDVRKGIRFPDGKINLKMFTPKPPPPRKEESFSKTEGHGDAMSIAEIFAKITK